MLTNNSIPLVKRELEGVLLGLIFYLVKSIIEVRDVNVGVEDIQKIVGKFKENFSSTIIVKEYRKLESLLSKMTPPDSQSSSIKSFLAEKTIIELSPFSYECLMTFITRKSLTLLNNELSNAVTIKVGDGKGPSFMRTSIPLQDLENINSTPIQPYPLREDTQLLQTLDGILKRKKIPILSMDSDPLSIPESKLKQKIEFTYNYLTRRTMDDNTNPTILSFTINDSVDNMTSVDISQSGRISVFGSIDGSIIVFYGEGEEIKRKAL